MSLTDQSHEGVLKIFCLAQSAGRLLTRGYHHRAMGV